MSTRSSRRPQVQTPLSPSESLLLAQATWELGAGPNAWQSVARLLSKHPLLSRPKSFFNAQSCHAMYEQLMKDAELELSEANDGPHAPMNLKLAERHFRSRHTELRELILTEESKFKTILKEIEDIRAGLWDKKIETKVTGKVSVEEDDTETPDKEEKTDAAPSKPTDEIFDGSELSGVTESVESASSTSLLKDEVVVSSTNEEQDLSQSTVASPADVPERSLTPQGNTKSPSPTLLSDVIDVIEQLVATTSQDDEMPLAAETVHSPLASESHTTLSDANVSMPINEDVDMESPGKNEEQKKEQTPEIEISPDVEEGPGSVDQRTGQRQEEEEEEEEGANQDEDIKEEISHEQQEDLSVEIESEGDVDSRPQPSEQEEEQEQSEHAQTPAIEIPVSDADAPANEGHSSGSEEEPREPTRRSTRRRKASVTLAPPISTRKRLRSQARLSESDLQNTMDSENEDEPEQEMRDEDTPQPEDEVSSPFDGVMTRRREGKRKASFLDNVDSPLEKKRMREDSEPVDEDEPGPSSHNTRGRITRQGMRTEEQVALKRFQNVIGMLHSQISQHRNGNIFHNPIKNSEAPDYHEIVKRPMDLKTIKARVKDGLIANSLEFQRDIFLMFANSMMYNRPGSDVYAMAEDMMFESEAQIIAFRQTEGMVKRGQRP